MTLDKYICELLFHEERVIVPGLGGFELNYESAQISGESQTFSPPTKKIRFNPGLIEDDGFLVSYLSEKMDKPADLIKESIANQVGQIFEKLTRKEKVNMEGLGTLSLSSAKKLAFTADQGNNFLLESYGLGTFTFPFLVQEKQSIFKRSTIFRRPEKPSRVILPGSIDKRIVNDKSRTNILISLVFLIIFSILPFNARISQAIFRQPASLGPLPSLIHLETPIDHQKIVEAKIVLPENLSNTDPQNEVAIMTFPIVAGSFQSSQKAEQFQRSLKNRGYNATVEQSGKSFFRVILSEYASLNDAEIALPELQRKNRDLDLWILK